MLIWEKVKVNNLPKEDPLRRNFNNSRKAIKVSWKRNGKTYSNYYTPESILGLWGINQKNIQEIRAQGRINNLLLLFQDHPMYVPMFRNPVTRNAVFRRNVKFVIMEKRHPANKHLNARAKLTSKILKKTPATRRKLAANAANKRATAFRTRGIPASKRKSK
jgi:hypothetical protein